MAEIEKKVGRAAEIKKILAEMEKKTEIKKNWQKFKKNLAEIEKKSVRDEIEKISKITL